jgi:hypothetical protein
LKKIPGEIKAATAKESATPGVSPSPQQSETPAP